MGRAEAPLTVAEGNRDSSCSQRDDRDRARVSLDSGSREVRAYSLTMLPANGAGTNRFVLKGHQPAATHKRAIPPRDSPLIAPSYVA
jgi:hypothetical protein